MNGPPTPRHGGGRTSEPRAGRPLSARSSIASSRQPNDSLSVRTPGRGAEPAVNRISVVHNPENIGTNAYAHASASRVRTTSESWTTT